MNEPVGLTVSGFYKYSIELNYYHFGKPITTSLDDPNRDEKIRENLSKGIWGKSYDSTDVLNIRRDNIPSMATILTGRIMALNQELWEEVYEVIQRDGVKYTPTCAITFTDVESLTPLIENTAIGKLIKAFRTRVKLYDALDEEYIVKSSKLQTLVEHAIKEQLLDVIDQMSEEETYTPPVDLSGILPPGMKQV